MIIYFSSPGGLQSPARERFTARLACLSVPAPRRYSGLARLVTGSEETRGDGQVTSSTEGVILRTDLKIDLVNELYITASQASNNLLPSPISQVSCWQHLKDPTKHLFLISLLNNLSLYNVT